MSAKLTLAALAAIVTVVSVQGPASARGISPTGNDPAFSRLQGPSLGQAPGNVMLGSRSLGRDPDPGVRFHLLRDKIIDRL
jgi:hypothetical protein